MACYFSEEVCSQLFEELCMLWSKPVDIPMDPKAHEDLVEGP